MRRRAVAVAAVLVLVAGCSPDASRSSDRQSHQPSVATTSAASSEVRKSLRVLVAGDSLAGGYYASTRKRGFEPLVTRILRDGYDVTPVVAAVSGARTWRIAQEVETVTAGQDPVDVAILEAGANDVGESTLREWRRWYRRLLRAVAATSPDATVVCLGPWGAREDAAPYEEVVQRLCRDHVYLPLSNIYERPGLRGPAGSDTVFGARDDYHPNDRGHAAIARELIVALDDDGIGRP